MTSDDSARSQASFADSPVKMPALFVGHGSPTNAIEDNEFSRAWIEAGTTLPKPAAVLCISAHWETVGTQVTAMDQPRTIHDFYGFPQPLYDVRYPAPGSPDLARLVRGLVRTTGVRANDDWGLDHGTWSVLCRMLPDAGVPIVQLSLDRTQGPEFHYALGRELRVLRHKGVLVVGSGNMVHNLRVMAWQDSAFDWAVEFDEKLKELILARGHDEIIHYDQLGPAARLSVPTPEHYLPLLYVLAVQDADERLRFFADRVTLGSISMRSFRIG